MPRQNLLLPAPDTSRGASRPGAWLSIGLLALSVAWSQNAYGEDARRQLEVQNHTSEPVRVFVAYHTITAQGQWTWFNTNDATSWVLQPGERTTLKDREFTINADLIRIRARGEQTGRAWDWGEHFIGEAARGRSRLIGKKLFTIWAEDGLHLFSDRHTRRTLSIRNSTSETLAVCMAYHTRAAGGGWGWQNADCAQSWYLGPGERSYPLINGAQLTANAIKIYARNVAGNRAWTEHRDNALFIGDYEGTGGVKGGYTYTFTEAHGRRHEPLVLRAVKLEPPEVAAGQPVTVVIEYTFDGFVAGKEQDIHEEQRIEREGQVLGRFTHNARRRPGTYRSKRKINIPNAAEPGKYTIVGSVKVGELEASKEASLRVTAP